MSYCDSMFKLMLFQFSLSLLIVIFFFKLKAAFEVRISDSSSDVCSSDLELSLVCALCLNPGHPCGSRSTRQGGREELCVGRTVATRDIAGRSVSISGGVRFSLLKQPESATQRRGHGRQALPPRFRHRSSERWRTDKHTSEL